MTQTKNVKSKKGVSSALKSERKVVAPLASGSVITTRPAMIRNTGPNGTTISNREFFLNISGSAGGGYAGTNRINPGNINMFPWAAKIAAQYDQYRFKKLHFIWKSRTGADNFGQIIFATDYDVTDPFAADRRQLETFEGCQTANIWVNNVVFKCDTAKLHPNGKRKYVCTTSFCPDADVLDLYAGRFNYYLDQTSGSTANFGEFWVDYEIELYGNQTTPTLDASLSADSAAIQLSSTNNTMFSAYRVALQTLGVGQTGNLMAYSDNVISANPQNVVSFNAATGTIISLPPGIVRLRYSASFMTNANETVTITPYVNSSPSVQVVTQGIYTNQTQIALEITLNLVLPNNTIAMSCFNPGVASTQLFVINQQIAVIYQV